MWQCCLCCPLGTDASVAYRLHSPDGRNSAFHSILNPRHSGGVSQSFCLEPEPTPHRETTSDTFYGKSYVNVAVFRDFRELPPLYKSRRLAALRNLRNSSRSSSKRGELIIPLDRDANPASGGRSRAHSPTQHNNTWERKRRRDLQQRVDSFHPVFCIRL